MEYITLNDGVRIDQIGYGTFLIPADGSTYNAVKEALAVGYRHIDTAAAYFNETEVGRAIKDSGIPRDEIFLTSKLWLQDYDDAKVGVERSLRHLGTHIDLYLIHQPYGNVGAAWSVLEDYKAKGDIRSIGVSNMTPAIWNKYVPQFDTKPSVNQIEFNPYCQQKEIREIMEKDNVKIEAWGPLGQGDKELLNDPVIVKLAEKYGKDEGQIMIRSQIQDGIVTLPKSTNPKRIKSNLDVFDFELTEAEMNEMRGLDKGHGKHDPDAPGVEDMLRKAFVIED